MQSQLVVRFWIFPIMIFTMYELIYSIDKNSEVFSALNNRQQNTNRTTSLHIY